MAWPFTVTTLNTTSNVSAIGCGVFGELVFNQAKSFSGQIDIASIRGNYTCTIGHKQFYRRGYSRPIDYYVRPRTQGGGGGFTSISILSTTGALIGRIRSDVEKTIISSLEFTIVKGDCRDFVLELNALPDFPLAPFSIIQVAVADSEFGWFIGKITDQDDLGAKNGNKFVYKGSGYTITDIQKLVFDDTLNFPAVLDVGEIISDIVQNQIVPFSSVRYNPSKIDINTGVLTANEIQPGKSKVPEFLDALAKMGGCDWGVDGDGDFFFLPIVTDVVRTFFVGYDINDFTPKLNLQSVYNTIFLQRQEGKSSGAAGWVVDAILSDPTSIAKYGKKEYRFQAPGFFSSDDLNIVGQSILEDSKEPKYSATADGFRIRSEDDFIRRGIHRFILPFNIYRELYNEGEDANQWTGTSGITIADDTQYFVFGASSVKFTCANDSGGNIELTEEFKGNIQKIVIWIRANKTGAYLTAGIGLGAWNQYTNVINIPVNETYFAYEWDISDLDLKKINKIGIGIDTDDAFELWIDKIEFVVKGFPYYKIASQQQTYRFNSNNADVKMEFEIIPSKMENYINNILALAEENKFTGEIR